VSDNVQDTLLTHCAARFVAACVCSAAATLCPGLQPSACCLFLKAPTCEKQYADALYVACVCCCCLSPTGLQPSDIASVEVLGGSTRVPAVYKLIETVYGVTPSRTLNAKEVVSRGAALQCAMISPLIKVGGAVRGGGGVCVWGGGGRVRGGLSS
jgi:hypothetical protein